MIFLEKEELKKIKKELKIDPSNYKPNWEHYYECYNYTVKNIIESGLKKGYVFNPQAKSFLFLMRHNIELFLKYNLKLIKEKIPRTHNLDELIEIFNNEGSMKKIIKDINFDNDGTCYRYSEVDFDNQICVVNFIKKFNDKLIDTKLKRKIFFEKEQSLNKGQCWDLTLHMNETKTLWHIKGQYDYSINFLIDLVIKKEIDINKVYLPLLFLIRHAIELGIKANIEDLNKKNVKIILENSLVNFKNKKEEIQEHSIEKLYNWFSKYLDQIDIEKIEEEKKIDFNKRKKEFKILKNKIHNLDINSNFFRFPIDSKNKEHELKLNINTLYDLLKIYSEVDTFITFTVDVLKDVGVLVDLSDYYSETELRMGGY